MIERQSVTAASWSPSGQTVSFTQSGCNKFLGIGRFDASKFVRLLVLKRFVK
jgi:hypothetical protein